MAQKSWVHQYKIKLKLNAMISRKYTVMMLQSYDAIILFEWRKTEFREKNPKMFRKDKYKQYILFLKTDLKLVLIHTQYKILNI